jgi:hypothetical protein
MNVKDMSVGMWTIFNWLRTKFTVTIQIFSSPRQKLQAVFSTQRNSDVLVRLMRNNYTDCIEGKTSNAIYILTFIRVAYVKY